MQLKNEDGSRLLSEPHARSDEATPAEARDSAEELCPTHVSSDAASPGDEHWWAPPLDSPGATQQPVVPCTPSPSSVASDPLLGTTVGSFRLVRRLGGGGMGVVYLGEHTVIGSRVAVKFLHEHFASNEVLIQRFRAEARVVNLIGHENIINIFDMNVLPSGRHYLVMEYLEGASLASMTGRPAVIALAVSILCQVCDALQAAHASGVIHRDLKPENIFLVRRDRMPHFVKVLDFGIAKLVDGARQLEQTSAGTLIGTPEYMAPEQWYGHAVDGRTDLYALGMIAYELLVGRPAFAKGGLGTLLHAHLMENPPTPHELRPEVPVALSEVVMRAMAKRPEDRFHDAAEMREALVQAYAGSGSGPGAAAKAPVVSSPTPDTVEEGRSAAPSEPRSLTPEAPPSSAPRGLSARLVLQPGGAPVTLACTDLAHGGVFLCTEDTPPPLRSRVSLTLEVPGRTLPCVAEIVHHVTSAQAQAWKMRPGFAVQFVELSQEARAVLEGLARGEAPTPEAPEVLEDDTQAELMLRTLFRRRKGDHYAVLCLDLDATFDDVRKRARAAFISLETLAARPLSPRQRQDVAEMRSRVDKALEVLGHAQRRIEYDAWRHNFAGVARCISSGISATELERLQARFLAEHPGVDAREQIHAHTAMAWASQGRVKLALREYERALEANPLRLTLQQRYWTLKRRGAESTSASEPEQDSALDVWGSWERLAPS